MLLLPASFGDAAWATIATKQKGQEQQQQQQQYHRQHCSCDLVIIGAGSSGFVASVAASLLGQKTALVEIGDHLGGDCTNAACVPSKALRSIMWASGRSAAQQDTRGR